MPCPLRQEVARQVPLGSMHQSKREPTGAKLGQWSLDLGVCHRPFLAITEADLDIYRLERQRSQRDVALNDEMTAKHRNATGVLFLVRGYFGGQWPMFSCQYQSM